MIRRALLLACAFVPAAFAQDTITGRYSVTAESGGTQYFSVLELEQKGDRLIGKYDGDDLTGTRHGDKVDFISRNKDGDRDEVHLTLKNGVLTGSDTYIANSPVPITALPRLLTARPEKPVTARAPRRHEFTPTEFQRAFSPLIKPVLSIAPGDTVHTTTVDAGGTDERNVSRSLGGNPETGPFYVEGVVPGDTVAIHIVRLRLNRDWAASDSYLVQRAVNPRLAVTMKDAGADVYWHLDRDKGLASPARADTHMKTYTVPVHPMLGCVAVAVPPFFAAPNTGDSGFYGGNMDFNEVAEGATVYLQAQVPGALIYVGDGHAVMGDGELNGNGLETSMDVEFRVEVLPRRPTPQPRVENDEQIMAMGYEGSLDESLKSATSNMQQWLASDYALTPAEASVVIGTAATIRVSEAADRNAGIAVIIDKARLKTLAK